jgi:large subunit ribosomal protein L9
LAEKICGLSLTFSVKTGEQGKMFGSITAADLVHKFAEHGITVDRRKIHLIPVKYIGQGTAKIKLHHEITIDFTFDVVSE